MREPKCPEVEVLQNYQSDPGSDFWLKFPSMDIPKAVESSININGLAMLLESCENILTDCELERAKKCVLNLKEGAGSFQKVKLPSCFTPNAKSSIENGASITDTVASWVKKGYVASPFMNPPLSNFRVNALMAIVQPEKVRPVLNVSLPKNFSFNDNVNTGQLEKVKMSSARKFSYAIVKSGKMSLISKFDMVDAYKCIPAPIEDLRLQGFQWLSRYFVELRQIFGAKTAVSNFDILGNTILTVTKAKCEIPAEFIHRTFDDVPFVSPQGKNWHILFTETYSEICKMLNVALAPDCKKLEKAFKNSTYGKVLGVNFNTEKMTWSLPNEKRNEAIQAIVNVLKFKNVPLNLFQKLMGRLNDISIMWPFMKCFKFPLYMCLGESEHVVLSDIAISDLCIWIRFLSVLEEFPIAHQFSNVPLSYKYFTSDAAGCVSCEVDKNVGCGSVGFDRDGIIIFAYQIFWPEGVLTSTFDGKNSNLGSKTTTLEFLGVLLPFLIIPEKLKNCHVIVKVDNIGCFYGWINRKTRGDIMASILIRALHVISAYLSCIVHVEHLPRKSSWDAIVADRLSRKSTTSVAEEKLLKSFNLPNVPKCLEEWMRNPVEDWSLVFKLLKDVRKRCENK